MFRFLLACAGLFIASSVSAQDAPSGRVAFSAFGGVHGIFDGGAFYPGYGAGASLRQFREGRSVDFALDGAFYAAAETKALAITTSVIWQIRGSRASLLGGIGRYSFFERGYISDYPPNVFGPHFGLGFRLSDNLGLENRVAFSGPFTMLSLLARVAF